MSWALWLVAAIAFAVIEIATTTLFVGPFALGALAAMVADLAGASAAVAVIVFLVVSSAAFLVVRPIARRHRRMPPRIRTGTAALIGQQAVVLEEVTRDGGTIKLAGETWSARSYDDERVLAAGARVAVVEIQGATALVDE
jgi:membrane protein implicated in regulation of membrane protease activity